MGSTLAARRAGRLLAANATAINNTTTTRKGDRIRCGDFVQDARENTSRGIRNRQASQQSDRDASQPVASYTVQVKRREIGIRIALGATPGLIAGQLQRYSLGLAVVGIAFGGLLSFWLRRAIETYLFRTDAGDWVVWLSVCSLILLCAVGASAIPARRAAKLDPMQVLRLD